jgi:hypothetical protein
MTQRESEDHEATHGGLAVDASTDPPEDRYADQITEELPSRKRRRGVAHRRVPTRRWV